MASPASRTSVTFVRRWIAATSFSQRRASGWTSSRSTPGALDAERARIRDRATAADDLDALGRRDRRDPPRETADDALRLPLAQRIQTDARRAEVHAELARALGFREQARDVEQRLRRD